MASAGGYCRASDIIVPPFCVVQQTVLQSIPNGGSGTPINFDNEIKDDYGMHDPANPSRVVSKRDGWYWIAGNISYAANGTGVRSAAYFQDGVALAGSGAMIATAGAGATTRVASAMRLIYLTVNEYVELIAYQNSGGALNTAVSTSEMPTFSVGFYCP